MADNYLEKQREEYEARKAAWERERKYGIKQPRPKPAKAEKEKKEEGNDVPSINVSGKP